tara:strand:- start:938 stop:1108 length:171 start_codon:yes stop_codon:yes gene_type:complete
MLGKSAALPWTTICLSARYEYSAALYVGSFSRASLYISKIFSELILELIYENKNKL